jgi:hypothetical protein
MHQLGSRFSVANARISEKVPAANPFMVTIVRGSFAEMSLVRLLSTPQRTHAARMPNAPRDSPHSELTFTERKILARVIAMIAHQARRLTDSLKASAAISVVATLSKLSRRDAVAAGVPRRPKSKTIGAAIPPARVAPASRTRSGFLILASVFRDDFPTLCTALTMSNPKPLPR